MTIFTFLSLGSVFTQHKGIKNKQTKTPGISEIQGLSFHLVCFPNHHISHAAGLEFPYL